MFCVPGLHTPVEVSSPEPVILSWCVCVCRGGGGRRRNPVYKLSTDLRESVRLLIVDVLCSRSSHACWSFFSRACPSVMVCVCVWEGGGGRYLVYMLSTDLRESVRLLIVDVLCSRSSHPLLEFLFQSLTLY